MSKRMIFTLLVMDSIGHNFHGIWRHPPQARNREFKNFDLWVDLAKRAEQAKIDAFFFTDVIGVQGEYNGSRDVIFEMAMNVPIGDCTMLIPPAMAHQTTDIGFLYTSSVIQHHPPSYSRAPQRHSITSATGVSDGTSSRRRTNRPFATLACPATSPMKSAMPGPTSTSTSSTSSGRGSWDVDAVVNDVAAGRYADPRQGA